MNKTTFAQERSFILDFYFILPIMETLNKISSSSNISLDVIKRRNIRLTNIVCKIKIICECFTRYYILCRIYEHNLKHRHDYLENETSLL